MTAKEPTTALCLHVQVDGISPPIWRRLLVPPTMSLLELHHVLQAAFEWDDYHLHDFRQGKGKARRLLALPEMHDVDFPYHDEEVPNEEEVLTGDVLRRQGASITYVYDYGDHWEHVIRLEERRKDSGPLPRCLEGARAAPPEDCGGVPGYQSCLDSMADPDSNPSVLEWLGDWSPERFDLRSINDEIRERLAEIGSPNPPLDAGLLELLDSPEDYGIPEQAVKGYMTAARDLLEVVPEDRSVIGYLEAPDAGLTRGVLELTEESIFEDDPWPMVVLFENEEDFLTSFPGDAPQPKRLLTVALVPTSDIPGPERSRLPDTMEGMVPVPAVVLPEGLTPPNHEELDLLAACLLALADSLGQWGAAEPLPPPVEGKWSIAGRKTSVRFIPDADLCGMEMNLLADAARLSLGFDKDEDGDVGEEDDEKFSA